MKAPANRLHHLPNYVFVAINHKIKALTAEGHDVIRLDIGNPDMPPPIEVIDALIEHSQSPRNHGYSGYVGIQEYREAIAGYYQKRFGVNVDPNTEVLALIGSKEGIANFTYAFIDKGDVNLIPDLGYPTYRMATILAGGEAVSVSSDENYHLNLDSIPKDVLARAKTLWVNYPSNPTGAVIDVAEYQRLVDFCLEHDLVLASDNPYVDITYDGYKAPSALQANNAKECTVEFVSFSKTYNMAGWRLAAAVGNAQAIQYLLKVKSNVDTGHFRPVYYAGITALEAVPESWIHGRNYQYQQRRDRIMAALKECGLEGQPPRGAMYVWAKVPDMNGDTFSQRALQEAFVSVAPGSAYGEAGTQYVRFGLGVPDDRLDEAMQRLIKWRN